MLWFRRKKKQQQEEQAPAEAAAPESRETAPEAPSSEAEAGEETEAAKRRRRRGTRGGRGRKKASADADGASGDDAEQQAEPRREAQPERRQARTDRKPARQRPQTRKRVAPRRAALPPAKRELLISVDVTEKRVAVIEDDAVAEVYLERPERRSIAGNIYLGVVDNVLPGMEAAFVEIGLEKNGFLYVDEIVVPELEGKRHGKKIQDLIARGQTLLVQAVKDPMKTKGARLTTEISLPGRFVVYVPQGEGLGVSRRLPDDERARLKEILKKINVKEGGVIVRTAAEGASAEDVERDLEFLQRLWKTIEASAATAKAPALIYQEAELPLRVIRDLFTDDFERALVDHERTYKRIVGYLKKTSPHMVDRVVRYKERAPLFESSGVDAQIRSTLSRRVDLPSGGYLIFDYAEAFTVIDVNTGRFVGSRSKTSGGRLEDTITKNNLEAVKEVVRQLRLRDIGGIIVIDFIDMANPKNRATVEEALRNELERDRTKTYVVEISPLGLVEMTRQNVTDGPREILTRKCPACAGDGVVVNDVSHAVEAERRLRALVAPGSRVQAYRVELHPQVASLLIGPGAERLSEIEAQTRRRFFLGAAGDGAALDHFVVAAEGKLDDLKPSAPVAEGQELELKLVEVGRWDSGAAIGKVDGLDVCVAGAAKLVGKRVKVRIERVLDGTAYAVQAGAAAAARAPITAESEAEKPTRARRPAGAKTPAPEVAEADAEAVAESAADDEGEAETDAQAESESAAAAKKRTRRGSRGGRGRKKKPAEDGAAVEGAAERAGERQEAELPEQEPEPPEQVAAADAHASQPESPARESEPESEPEPAAASPKPRRRRARIHVPGPASDAGDESTARMVEPVAGEPEPVSADAEAAPGEDEADGGEATAERADDGDADGADGQPKKRTRRGSRGGRRRKKKPAGAVAEGEDASEDGEVADVEEIAEAVEQAPVFQEAPAEAPEVRREDEEEPEPAPAASDNGGRAEDERDEDWTYVPMSEWGTWEGERG